MFTDDERVDIAAVSQYVNIAVSFVKALATEKVVTHDLTAAKEMISGVQFDMYREQVPTYHVIYIDRNN